MYFPIPHSAVILPGRVYFFTRVLLSARVVLPFLALCLCLARGCYPLPPGARHTSGNVNRPGDAFPERGELCLLWYNTENLFHPSDAPGPADDAFTPEGERRWTMGRYERKLTAVARIVVAAGRGSPPEIVGLAEIEEGRVLEDLVAHPILLPYDYAYLHREGPDHRGMEVACLIRGKLMEEIRWRHFTDSRWMPADSTRAMLSVSCRTAGGRDLELVLLHFLSRYRGAGASAPLRREQMRSLCALLDSLHRGRPASLVVAAGDFNAEPGDWSVGIFPSDPARSPGAYPGGCPDLGVFPDPLSCRGSYRYRGHWSLIDYFLAVDAKGKLKIGGWVLELPPLLCEDASHGGEKPFRTYEGFSYRGGPSDHLPVVLDISW